ncbi:MAG TPA: hypothetical protein PKA88_02350, partial [Polyangiaceae bacterium]|nr:hypothetical protein [Polyangiaceae bacterium]
MQPSSPAARRHIPTGLKVPETPPFTKDMVAHAPSYALTPQTEVTEHTRGGKPTSAHSAPPPS